MNDRRELRFIEWLQDGPNRGPAEGLGELFAVTRSMPQRPAWLGWIAPITEEARATFQWLPRTLVYVALIGLLLLALWVVLIVGAPRPLPPPFGPARNGVVAYEMSGSIYVLDSQTGDSRQLGGVDGVNKAPKFSHDGTRIAFWSTRDTDTETKLYRLYVGTADLRNLQEISGSSGYVLCPCYPPEWSPDDRTIVFQARNDLYERNDDQPRLYTVAADGSSEPVAITDTSVGRRQPLYSPDGQWLAFEAHGLGDAQTSSIGFIRVDGSDERIYDTQPAGEGAGDFADGGIRWSPDSTRVAYTRGSQALGFASALMVATLDGDVEQLHVEPGGWQFSPRWSPDGTKIALLAGERHSRLVVIDVDQKRPRTIPLPVGAVPDLADSECALEWSPDGESLVVRCTDSTPFVVSPTDPYTLEYLDIPAGPDSALDWQRLAP